MSSVPELRRRACNDAPERPEGDFVLYWMIAFRRADWNFALQRAVDLAREWKRPLLVLEALRCDYRWASDRLHRFVLDGMRDNRDAFEGTSVRYYPYVEPRRGAGKGLLAALAERACAVVTDEFPCFFLPNMVAAAGERLPVRLEAVDSNGLLPLRAADRVFPTAYAFRRFLQRELEPHLSELPKANPASRVSLPPLRRMPADVEKRWPPATAEVLEGTPEVLGRLPLDHSVAPVDYAGGSRAARKRLRRFLGRLERYAEDRNQPEEDATSRLSPYLHFGHVSVHRVLHELAKQEGWSPNDLAGDGRGQREGWWNMSSSAEAFLDELVTWREVGYNFSSQRDDYDRFESLPDWALETLAEHEPDPREHLYALGDFETARTHDELWNAAQRQLVRDGHVHSYLRMLWGKKILEWSATPQKALEIMIELNNKYGVDGRNPNSYSGILWCLGRYDRPWGPERAVFGKIRYMTSANTRRKVRVAGYLERYGAGEGSFGSSGR